MATAKKTAAPLPRRAATTSIKDSAEVVEKTDGEKITLSRSGELGQDVEMVTVVVPKAFLLTRDNGVPVPYAAGVCEMPVDDAAHWFARAAGVKVYQPGN